MIGRKVSHYGILEKLGQGGMGEVYLALDQSLDRKVALKFLSAELRADETARERFLHEARAAANLDHPFICKIYEAAESGGVLFIAMEYVEGEDLASRLSRGPLPVREAMQAISEVAEALEVAHDRKIVHRDLKPANIMLTRGGHVKVMDFGLAKRLAPFSRPGTLETLVPGLTIPGTVVGTLDYMSPEQIRGLEVDMRSDLFSLGVVFFEAVTGAHPFRRETPVETGSAILREPPAPLSRFLPECPPALEHVLRRMLAKDREDRYQSAAAVVREIRLIRFEPVSGSGRRLAAIMSAEMADYGSIAQLSEALASRLLEETWRLLRSIFPKHAGQEVKAVGDTILVEFASALEAAQCAIEIQRTMLELDRQGSADSRVRLRIGLHLGDVIHQQSDVLGDGVNIAARLHRIAPPGGICLSEDVANQVADKIDFPLSPFHAEQAIEDSRRPIRVLSVDLSLAISGAGMPRSGRGPGPGPVRSSDPSAAIDRPVVNRRIAMAAIGAVAVGALAFLLWWAFYPRTSAFGFQERDWMLICDFENLTGEGIFDKSLDTALRVSITQSSYVNVMPRSRIDQVLRRMRKETTARIDEPTGREIAQREGIKVLLVPSITGIAGTYAISSTLEDPVTGTALKSGTIRVPKKADVLNSLDRLARDTRESLGESVRSIARQGKPLVKVTTSSLDALKQYSLAIDNHRRGNMKDARVFYESALAMDPGFTAAKASLGMMHCDAYQARVQWGIVLFAGFDHDLGRKLLADAVQHVDGLTDRERYGVLAFHARAVQNDLPKAIQHLQVLAGLYPDDSSTRNNLGWFHRQMGQFEDAEREYKEALRIDPTFMIAYDSLNGIYLYEQGRAGDAIALCQKQIAQDDSYYRVYDNLGWACLGKSRYEEARSAFEKAAALNPKWTHVIFRVAHSLRLQKKYREALQSLEGINESENRIVHYQRGLLSLQLNDRPMAETHLGLFRGYVEKQLREKPKSAPLHVDYALVLARLGQVERALAAQQQAAAIDPKDHFGRALVSAALGRTDEALGELQRALEGGFRDYIWMKVHPDLEGLAADPRFQAMLARTLK